MEWLDIFVALKFIISAIEWMATIFIMQNWYRSDDTVIIKLHKGDIFYILCY